MPGVDLVPLIEQEIKHRSGKRERDEIRFLCPAHDDHHPSARWNPAKEVWTCDVCGAGGGRVDLADRLGIEAPIPVKIEEAPPGLTVEHYAEAKRLSVDRLERWGVSCITHHGHPVLAIPYMDEAGQTQAIQLRTRLDGARRFQWRNGDKARVYGEWLLDRAHNSTTSSSSKVRATVTPSGHTASRLSVCPAPIPSRKSSHRCFDGFEKILFPVEPDQGGQTLSRALAKSHSPIASKSSTSPHTRTSATCTSPGSSMSGGPGSSRLRSRWKSRQAVSAEGIVSALEQLPEGGDPEALLRALGESLASEDSLRRELLRERTIKALSGRLKSPGKVVDAALKTHSPVEKVGGQGQLIALQDPELWSEEVDGHELLRDLAQTLARHVVLVEGAATAIALGSVMTYCFDAFDVSPILAASSPEKRCGKTTLLGALRRLVLRALPHRTSSPLPCSGRSRSSHQHS